MLETFRYIATLTKKNIDTLDLKDLIIYQDTGCITIKNKGFDTVMFSHMAKLSLEQNHALCDMFVQRAEEELDVVCIVIDSPD